MNFQQDGQTHTWFCILIGIEMFCHQVKSIIPNLVAPKSYVNRQNFKVSIYNKTAAKDIKITTGYDQRIHFQCFDIDSYKMQKL